MKNKIALEAGGLFIVGTRDESKELIINLGVDLVGRSWCFQGHEDDLMRIFGSEKPDSVLQTLGFRRKRIDPASMDNQSSRKTKKVEARNYLRKVCSN